MNYSGHVYVIGAGGGYRFLLGSKRGCTLARPEASVEVG